MAGRPLCLRRAMRVRASELGMYGLTVCGRGRVYGGCEVCVALS